MATTIVTFGAAVGILLIAASFYLPKDELLQAAGFCVATSIALIVILSL